MMTTLHEHMATVTYRARQLVERWRDATPPSTRFMVGVAIALAIAATVALTGNLIAPGSFGVVLLAWLGATSFRSWVWPALDEAISEAFGTPPVLRALGSAPPGCDAIGAVVADDRGPRFSGRLMCWRPAGPRWLHYDRAQRAYWN